MPFSIEITLNVLWIPLVCLLAAFLGFLFRSAQLGKLKAQIAKLENQIRHGDAELLVLQKEYVALQDRLSNNSVPVVPITTKENSEGLPDTNSRKKLLGKSTVTHHS